MMMANYQLENRYTRKGIVGSNPTPSATFSYKSSPQSVSRGYFVGLGLVRCARNVHGIFLICSKLVYYPSTTLDTALY